MEAMEARIAGLEGAYRQVADRLNSIDARLNSTDQRFDRLDARLDALGSELRSELRTATASLASRTDALGVEVRAKMDGQLKWFVGILVTCAVAAAGAWVTTVQAVLGFAKLGH